jgi:hypothetical protein
METPNKDEKVEYKWIDRCFTRDDLEHAFKAGMNFVNGSKINFSTWFANYLKQLNNA